MRVVFLALLALPASSAAQGTSLRFHGNGYGDIDRVKIQLDDPATVLSGPPADVGAQDFTLEFWMRAAAAENPAGAIACGSNENWIYGNIVFDRDRYSQGRKFGLSIGDRRLSFGVINGAYEARTICGATDVLDDAWHHVAVQRRRADGRMWIWVDGQLDAEADGPDGDVSYPDDGVPGSFCGGPCDWSDPFLVIGAEKHDAGPSYPSYAGYVDEVRLSNAIRYATPFTPAGPFVTDASTVALYHLDEGAGDVVGDSSGAPGGPSDGVRKLGGVPAGPEWTSETPFGAPGCGVSSYGAGTAVLASGSVPQVGTTMVFDLSGFAGDAAGTFALSTGQTSLPFLGGTLLVDPAGLLLQQPIAVVGGAGATSVAIPPNPALAGATGYAQAGVMDGSAPQGWALTNGLAITLCP